MKYCLLSSVALLCGCAASSSVPPEWREPASFGQDAGPYQRDRLLEEQNGWQLWRRQRLEEALCIAFKPAREQPPPAFSEGPGLLRGGHGFHIAFKEFSFIHICSCFCKHNRLLIIP